METFKKRQKEMRRLEKARDKAEKRKEIKARKAAGLPPLDEEPAQDEAVQTEDVSPSSPEAVSPDVK